jgi:alkanesulfonate monooxygenase SsuD/methylene tetrahydromethanopterin reductase-like flavin-dependent oxidoreductase (luciferase family)
MLRLVGRKGDGWLPSLSWVGVDGLGRGNRVIDEAAEGSGRDPREIRRLLKIGVVEGQSLQWVEQLRPMALEHGVSTFISMGDDP